MASPTVQVGTNTARTSAETTSPVNYPATTANKELLILHGRVCAAGTITVPGFTQLVQDATDASDDVEYVGWKQADGTEGGTTVSVTHGSARSSWVMTRVQGADLPTVNPPKISAAAIGATATVDPPLLTPSYGSQTYLWLWLGGWEGEQTNPPATPPTGYTLVNNAATGTTGNTDTNNRIADYRFASTAASENPPSLTISVAAVGWTAWTLAIPPPLAQTVTLGLITNSPTMFAPTVQSSVTLGLISSTGSTFAPTVKNNIVLGLISSTGTTFSPTVKNAVVLGLISNSPTIYSPTLTLGDPILTVTVPLITNTPTIYAPSVQNAVSLGLITQTGATFDPTVKNNIVLGLITNSATMYVPSVNPSVSVGLISSTGSTFSPTLQHRVVLGVISNQGSVFDPNVVRSISLGLITNTPTTFTPQVNQNVALGLISNSYSIFSPTVKNAVVLGLISNSPTLFQPAVSNTVTLGLLSNSYTIYSPTVTAAISVPLISSSGVAFTPTLIGMQIIDVPLITSLTTVYAPSIQGRISLPLIQGTLDPFGSSEFGDAEFGSGIPHVYDINLVRTIPLQPITNSYSIFAPAVYQRVDLSRLDSVGFVMGLAGVKLTISIPRISSFGTVFAPAVQLSRPDPDILLIGSSAPVIERGGSYGSPSTLTGVGRKDTVRWASSARETRLTAERSV